MNSPTTIFIFTALRTNELLESFARISNPLYVTIPPLRETTSCKAIYGSATYASYDTYLGTQCNLYGQIAACPAYDPACEVDKDWNHGLDIRYGWTPNNDMYLNAYMSDAKKIPYDQIESEEENPEFYRAFHSSTYPWFNVSRYIIGSLHDFFLHIKLETFF